MATNRKRSKTRTTPKTTRAKQSVPAKKSTTRKKSRTTRSKGILSAIPQDMLAIVIFTVLQNLSKSFMDSSFKGSSQDSFLRKYSQAIASGLTVYGMGKFKIGNPRHLEVAKILMANEILQQILSSANPFADIFKKMFGGKEEKSANSGYLDSSYPAFGGYLNEDAEIYMPAQLSGNNMPESM